MKVKFTLTMDDVTVAENDIDCLIIDWIDDVDEQEVIDLSHRWISTQNFLSKSMEGLTRVGESSLTIEPIDIDGDQPAL
ncbi:MAG TPA: hypothetical protein VLB27_02735 [candidate division Zixibacteria bacterium]|nr:hypothetical protein [candidate division Zixibacteria bacterium]